MSNPDERRQDHGTRQVLRKLEEMDGKIDEVRDNTRTTSIKLFGHPDADQETPEGRLPKVEKLAKRAHARIDSITYKIAWMMGAAAAILFILEHYAHKLGGS